MCLKHLSWAPDARENGSIRQTSGRFDEYSDEFTHLDRRGSKDPSCLGEANRDNYTGNRFRGLIDA